MVPQSTALPWLSAMPKQTVQGDVWGLGPCVQELTLSVLPQMSAKQFVAYARDHLYTDVTEHEVGPNGAQYEELWRDLYPPLYRPLDRSEAYQKKTTSG